jgi:signal recognition particle subunit SRP68
MDEIEPMLRFCAYKSGKDTSKGVNVIAKEIAEGKLSSSVKGWDDLKARLEEEGSKEKKEQIEVRWRGEIVPVRNVELVDVAVKVQRVLESLAQDDATSKRGGEGSAGKKKADGKKDILGARRMGTYDKALLILGEAEQVASQLVDDNKVSSSLTGSNLIELTSSSLARTDCTFERPISSI